MAAVTKLTGVNGVVNIGGVDQTVAAFTITIKRGMATQPRVGKYSDRHKAGKVEVSGSVTFQDINGAMLARLLNATITSPVSLGEAATFTLYGDAVLGTDRVKVQLANCFFTQGALKFGDANSFIDGDMAFEMQDPDADLTLTYT